MFAVPYSVRRWDNLSRGTGQHFCLLCAKDIKPGSEAGWVIYGNNDSLLTEAEAADHPELNQGGFPVGRECWKRVPTEYRG